MHEQNPRREDGGRKSSHLGWEDTVDDLENLLERQKSDIFVRMWMQHAEYDLQEVYDMSYVEFGHSTSSFHPTEKRVLTSDSKSNRKV